MTIFLSNICPSRMYQVPGFKNKIATKCSKKILVFLFKRTTDKVETLRGVGKVGVKSATLVGSLLFQVAKAWEMANRLDYDKLYVRTDVN